MAAALTASINARQGASSGRLRPMPNSPSMIQRGWLALRVWRRRENSAKPRPGSEASIRSASRADK